MLLLWPCNVDLDLIRSHQQSLGNIGHTVVSCVRVPIQASPWSLWDSWAEPDLSRALRSGSAQLLVGPGKDNTRKNERALESLARSYYLWLDLGSE